MRSRGAPVVEASLLWLLLMPGACGPDRTPAGPSAPPPPPPLDPRAGHYAAPWGTGASPGDPSRPWDLETALAGGDGRVEPGDTIWLRGGVYRGAFLSSVAGTPERAVVVRPHPGERAVIDGAGETRSTLTVTGAWTVFQELELTNSNRNRAAPRPDVVFNDAPHTRYVNLVIHDGGVAFYTEPAWPDVEVYGCIIYNNGWQGSERGHGHGLYAKNDAGPVRLRDNVLFNQFGYGVHVYSDAGSGRLTGIRIEGNVAFNNGSLASNSTAANILVGGYERADDILLGDNVAYAAAGPEAINVQVGYDSLVNGTLTMTGNYLVGGSPVLDVGFWEAAAVGDNTLIGTGLMQMLRSPTTLGLTWSSNTYFRDPAASAWGFAGVSYPFLTWQLLTGLGLGDRTVADAPAATRIFIRPNAHEPGRATIVVYNWARAPSASIDPAAFLSPGDRYEAHNVQDLFGSPVAAGTYEGSPITLPLTGVTPPPPIGMPRSPAPKTGPAFDVFLIRRR